MFRDGNNQAMQLVMQGYSDSIRAKTSNQGTAMANAFGQGLSNAVQTHDNHEQAMRNRALTDEQIQTAKHNNAYLADTHDTRVAQTHQQEMMNDLDIKFKSDTHDYRVGQEKQAERQMRLNNDYQQQTNKEQVDTSKSRVDATINQNYATSSQAKTDKKHSDMQRANYEIESVFTDGRGNYYYDAKRTQEMDSGTAEARMQRNAEKEKNRREYQSRFTSDNRQVVAGNQAQEAQNINNMNMQNQQKAQFDEAMGAIQASGDTYNDIFYKLGEAARNNEPEITLGNGTKMSVEMANIVAHGMGRGNGVGIGGGVNVNNSVKTTFKEELADAINVLKNPNATPEQLSAARSVLLQDKNIKALNEKVNSYAHLAQNAKDITDQDRLTTFQGFVTQYLGGKAASVYGNLKSKESMILTGLATNALKGALTERDMQIVRQQVQNLRKSGGFNEGVLRTMLDKMISEVEGAISTYETPHILAPDIYKKFESMKVLRQALD